MTVVSEMLRIDREVPEFLLSGFMLIYFKFTVCVSDLQAEAASFILKSKEKHKIPQNVIDGIIADVTTFFSLHLSFLHSAFKQQLKDNDIDDTVIEAICSTFDYDNVHRRPFKGLETEYLQHKFFKQKFSMIVSSLCYNLS